MEINLQLQRVEINRPYGAVITDFEKNVPLVDLPRLHDLVDNAAGADAVMSAIKSMAGASHLTRFCSISSGELFSILEGTPVESVKYLVGNALIAQKIFRHGLTAGLYVPFVLNFYGHHGKTILEYFLPSSFLVNVSRDTEVTGIGQTLDGLMVELVGKLNTATK